jgi:hypothetical protein
MSDQSGIHEEVASAFESALRTIMLATASCAGLAGLKAVFARFKSEGFPSG